MVGPVTTSKMARNQQTDSTLVGTEELAGQNILVVEDQASVAQLLRSVLVSEGGRVRCVGSHREAVESAHASGFDAALVDVFLPDGNGLDIARLLRSARCPCAAVLITGTPTPDVVARAIDLGVTDVLFKPFERDALVDAVARAAATSGRWRDRRAQARNGHESPAEADMGGASSGPVFSVPLIAAKLARNGQLTERETESLRLMLRGFRIEEMAKTLSISENTIKFHVRNILRKLGLRSRSELLKLLVE